MTPPLVNLTQPVVPAYRDQELRAAAQRPPQRVLRAGPHQLVCRT